MDEAKLKNAYVKDYYNAQVSALSSSYMDERWHTSKVKEFEYGQTKRALEKALGVEMVSRALEIGPGDGVWTSLIFSRVTGNLHLVEQSEEMLKRAKEHLVGTDGITFEQGDFLKANPPPQNDLVVAVRCFEYFDQKEVALKKIHNLLVRGGKLIVITKNAKLMTSKKVQHQTLHSDQCTRSQMEQYLRTAGFTVEAVYPAIFRLKASYPPIRFLFGLLHRLMVATQGVVRVPFETYATESHVYVARA
jgi:ubiquinone/menaquinone biosynthesis C-methylase UbiE